MNGADYAKGMEFVAFLFCFVLFMAGFAVGTFVGCVYAADRQRKQAVQAGVGEWVVDKDGWTSFRWKECK